MMATPGGGRVNVCGGSAREGNQRTGLAQRQIDYPLQRSNWSSAGEFDGRGLMTLAKSLLGPSRVTEARWWWTAGERLVSQPCPRLRCIGDRRNGT